MHNNIIFQILLCMSIILFSESFRIDLRYNDCTEYKEASEELLSIHPLSEYQCSSDGSPYAFKREYQNGMVGVHVFLSDYLERICDSAGECSSIEYREPCFHYRADCRFFKEEHAY